jgi:serine/threonine protein kinase
VDEVAAKPPRRIQRYRVEQVLGNGGFAIVHLAHDDQLQRLVAIKVPHRRVLPTHKRDFKSRLALCPPS